MNSYYQRMPKAKTKTFRELAIARANQRMKAGAIANIKKMVSDRTKEDVTKIPWAPIPDSPQEKAYNTHADELFYGGAGGSGKTDLLLGLAGTQSKNAIIFRRIFPSVRALIERSREIYNFLGDSHTRDSYNESLHLWRLLSGRTVEFASIQYEKDKEKYRGRPHDLYCVGKGTSVWMADGTRKPIEDVKVGDYVQTLGGGRQVTRTIQQVKPAAQIQVFDNNGQVIASQIQGTTHNLMSVRRQWVCHDTEADGVFRLGAFLSNEFHSKNRLYRWSKQSYSVLPLLLLILCSDLLPLREYALSREACQDELELHAEKEPRVRGSDVLLFDGKAQAFCKHLSQSLFLLKFALTVLRQSVFSFYLPSPCRDALYAPAESLPEDLTDDYSICSHRNGGHIRLWQDVALAYPPPLNDSEKQNPIYLPNDDAAKTQKHNRPMLSYVHPYTKETHQTAYLLSGYEALSSPIQDSTLLYDLTVHELNHYITDNGFINQNCWDEITEFTESQFRFVNTWNRTADPNQRCRIVATGNPPTSPQGLWVLDYWAPWLKPDHPDKASPGDLVWFVRIGDRDVEIARTLLKDIDPNVPPVRPTLEVDGKLLTARSRTFIPGRVEDNPYLMATGYDVMLDSLPEPLRSQMRYGIFGLQLKDDVYQIIPAAWVDAAMARWTELPLEPLSAIGCDPARGGADRTAISCRHNNWFNLFSVPGSETPDGLSVAQLIIPLIPEFSSPDINVDVIGVGGAPVDALNQLGYSATPINSSASSDRMDRTNKIGFVNLRSQIWWQFREALDPDYGSTVALPPNAGLKAELCATRWSLRSWKIAAESKDNIKDRIGRSPDEGEAILYASFVSSSNIVDLLSAFVL